MKMKEPKLLQTNAVFFDERGLFSPTEIFETEKQINISFNEWAGTFRGMHLQKGYFAQTKRLRVIRGSIIDFCVSLIPGDDRERVFDYQMNPGDEIIVPKGWAHGFITLKPGTIVQYVVDNAWYPDSEVIINYRSWPEIVRVVRERSSVITINQKDNHAPFLHEVAEDIEDSYLIYQ